MKRHFKKWGAAFALMAALLSGCQSVDGFDFNKAISGQVDVQSMEQSGSVQLDIDWNPSFTDAADPQVTKLLAMLGKVRVDIENARSDSEGRASAKGSLVLEGKPPIAFALLVDEDNLRLDVEGAKRPFVLDIGDPADQSSSAPRRGPLLDQQAIQALAKQAAGFFVRHLPNPPKLDVKRDFSKVGEDYVSLTKVHAELDGEQLGELLVRDVNALAEDEAGLRELIAGIVKWVSELPPELLPEMGGGMGIPLPEDSTALAEQGYQAVTQLLKELQKELAQAKAKPEWALVFDKGITMKADLYWDDSLQLRKSDLEITAEPAVFQLPSSPVRRVAVHVHTETWNVSGAVSVPAVSAPSDAIGPRGLEQLPPVQFVRLFEEDSAVYGILKHDLQIDDAAYTLDGGYGSLPAPHIREGGGSVHVPLRQALEGLDDKVTYTAKTGELRFTDYATWQEVVLHVDSQEALVNGKAITLSEPVHRHGSSVYMAAEDLFPLLKADYEAKTDVLGNVAVTVKRDL